MLRPAAPQEALYLAHARRPRLAAAAGEHYQRKSTIGTGAGPVWRVTEVATDWHPSGVRTARAIGHPHPLRGRCTRTRSPSIAIWFALTCATAMPARSARAADGRGTYLLHDNAHLQVTPFATQDYPGEMRVTIDQADGPKRMYLRLESHGHACVLCASRSAS